MPAIEMYGPTVAEIVVACPRKCGNTEVIVYHNLVAKEFYPELSCSTCDDQVRTGRVVRPPLPNGRAYGGPSWNFREPETEVLVASAKAAWDARDEEAL